MIWLTWRLQRAEFGFLALILAGLIGALLLTHSDVAALTGLEGCTPGSVTKREITINPTSQSCASVVGPFFRLVNAGLPWFNFVPLIAAILLALPLVHELETGTYRLAWTQGVTRQHWESVKLGVLVASGVAFAGLFSVAFDWWSGPANTVSSRLGRDTYDFLGVLPIAHTLFAIALVLFLGTVLRRQIASITLASIVYIVTRLVFSQEIRPRLVNPLTATASDFGALADTHVWITGHFWENASHQRIGEQQVQSLCPPPETIDPGSLKQCITRNGLVEYIQYHPDAHFWRFQMWEAGIFFGITVLLIGFSAWYLFARIE